MLLPVLSEWNRTKTPQVFRFWAVKAAPDSCKYEQDLIQIEPKTTHGC